MLSTTTSASLRGRVQLSRAASAVPRSNAVRPAGRRGVERRSKLTMTTLAPPPSPLASAAKSNVAAASSQAAVAAASSDAAAGINGDVAITGATGTVGARLVRRLVACGVRVRVLTRVSFFLLRRRSLSLSFPPLFLSGSTPPP